MILRYSKAFPATGISGEKLDLKDLFSQLYLMTDGDIAQTLEWIRRLGEQHGFINRDRTFEDVLDELERQGLIKREAEGINITPGGEREIRETVFEKVFSGLHKSLRGGHATGQEGRGPERLPETRPYRFGDEPGSIDFSRSVHNSLIRRAEQGNENLLEEDLEVYESENVSNCSTVLMLDISHSMILYGEDRITPAKMVAVALVEYIRKRFPRDTIDVLTFGDDAQIIPKDKIAEVSIGPYHTNTCDGLKLAQSILRKRRNRNKQIFMITDGKPSAVYDRGRLYRNSFGLDPLVLSKTYAEANRCRKSKIRVSTFMIARDNYLMEFIENFTRICDGKAFYTGLGDLSEFVFVDYAANRRSRLRKH